MLVQYKGENFPGRVTAVNRETYKVSTMEKPKEDAIYYSSEDVVQLNESQQCINNDIVLLLLTFHFPKLSNNYLVFYFYHKYNK